jgi:hypothetical protein
MLFNCGRSHTLGEYSRIFRVPRRALVLSELLQRPVPRNAFRPLA